MKEIKVKANKKNQKRSTEIKIGLKKLTNFISRSTNKVYKNFKKTEKLKKK